MPDKKVSPGWYRDISNNDYHTGPGVSSSYLKKFLEQTPDFIKNGEMKPLGKDAQTGTAVHSLVLEPENFKNEVAVMPSLNLRTKEGREKKERFLLANKKKTVIDQTQFEQADCMAKAIVDHPTVRKILDGAINESSIYWWFNDDTINEGKGIFCKARPDIISPKFACLGDIKTIDEATYTNCQRTIDRFHYDLSARMYLDGVNQCAEIMEETGGVFFKDFILIFVERNPPYQVVCRALGPKYLQQGETKFKVALRRYAEAKNNDFPSYQDQVEIIEPGAFSHKLKII
jgi:exodeoxyribonuclease VIII